MAREIFMAIFDASDFITEILRKEIEFSAPLNRFDNKQSYQKIVSDIDC